MDAKTRVAENIKKYLVMQGKSQVDLARHLGLTKAAITNWIKGTTSPDINNISEICNYLDISVNDLFGTYDEKYLSVEEKIFVTKYRETDFRNAINKLLEK
ncbi:MAG: helix-turn-helix transcriptional regulator [bacterium]